MNNSARLLRFPTPAPKKARIRKESPIVQQVRTACSAEHRLPTVLGAILGGGVPIASFQVAHHDALENPYLWVVVAGCLLFSSLTVYRWATLAFGSPVKALGYCLCLEVVLTFATTPWLALGALIVLVGINAVATGAQLALGGKNS